MADRRNKFLLKRSNVAGKVPTAGDLLLGEMALNTADVVLYTSGTTANSIVPIGWDRVHRTGDTINGNLVINGDLTVTGNTSLKNTNVSELYSAGAITATTYYGDGSNLTGIDDFYVTGGTVTSGGTMTLTRNDDMNVVVTGFASSDQIITEASMLDIYQTGATNNATSATYVDITWDAIALLGSDFSISSPEITILSSGYYEIVYSVSLDRAGSGQRGNSRTRLVLDEGGGYNEIVRSGFVIYHRTGGGSTGVNTGTKNIKQFFNVGDKIKLQFQVNSGGGDYTTVTNDCNITITRLAV